MSRLEAQSEPSMDEILAQIRKIIADEPINARVEHAQLAAQRRPSAMPRSAPPVHATPPPSAHEHPAISPPHSEAMARIEDAFGSAPSMASMSAAPSAALAHLVDDDLSDLVEDAPPADAALTAIAIEEPIEVAASEPVDFAAEEPPVANFDPTVHAEAEAPAPAAPVFDVPAAEPPVVAAAPAIVDPILNILPAAPIGAFAPAVPPAPQDTITTSQDIVSDPMETALGTLAAGLAAASAKAAASEPPAMLAPTPEALPEVPPSIAELPAAPPAPAQVSALLSPDNGSAVAADDNTTAEIAAEEMATRAEPEIVECANDATIEAAPIEIVVSPAEHVPAATAEMSSDVTVPLAIEAPTHAPAATRPEPFDAEAVVVPEAATVVPTPAIEDVLTAAPAPAPIDQPVSTIAVAVAAAATATATASAPAAVVATPQATAVATAPAAPEAAAIEVDASDDPATGLEDSMADLLRPMLRQWLDEHMPRIVEKALRVEMAQSRKGKK